MPRSMSEVLIPSAGTLSQVGLAGTAAALTNAIYHATGVRIRELPLRIESLL